MTTAGSDKASRPFDVVLFGATGYTGKLVAEWLARRHGKALCLAIAGRNREKLERVKQGLVDIEPALGSLEILIGDSSDPATLEPLVRSARVVCSTVGPYAKYGLPLVAACAEHGTDYCDITGEVPFIREAIDRFDARAQATRARIVPTCGFDSIPSDLGVLMLHEHLQQKHGRRLERAAFFCGPMKGGMSGGTLASMMNLMQEASRDPAVRDLLADPYALAPDRTRDRGPDGPDQRGVRFDEQLGEWTGPFVMAAINTRVVRRTRALLGGDGYGKDFRYGEAMSFGRGTKGWARATAFAAGTASVVAGAGIGSVRGAFARLLPSPGEGPSERTRDAGFFVVRVLGESEPGPSGDVIRVMARLEGHSDPGYGETAKMLGEAAVCLARDADRLPQRYGLLTPASALGSRLVERLREAGMTLDVADRP